MLLGIVASVELGHGELEFAVALLFIVLGSRMMTPMLLMIDQLVVLLAWRVVIAMLFLSWRITIVCMLLIDLLFLASLWRSLSSSRRNLPMHASLKSLFLNFFAKCFFLFSSLSASVGYGSA